MTDKDKQTIKLALLSMGYREQKPGIWLKPLGWQLFCYREDKATWYNWFRDCQNKLSLWDSHAFSDESKHFLFSLKGWETWTKHDLFCSQDSQFEFISNEALIETMM